MYVLKPLSDTLVAEGSLVYDSMSGASPLYYNALSGASGLGVTDYRTAGDVKMTRYLDGAAVGVGAAVSSGRDYLSRALSLDVRLASADRNRGAARPSRCCSKQMQRPFCARKTLCILVSIKQVA
jgi:hypothetical protein